MKIVFFGTSSVALPILEALNQHHEILAVVTSPDKKVGRKQETQESPVSVLAQEMNHKILKPESVKGNDLLRLELEDLGADLFVVVSYGYILPTEIINLPKFKTINVHFSLLPKYRGPAPIQYALLNGDSETGTSIFVLDEQVDHGPLLAQLKVAIDSDDNFITLGDKLARKSAELLLTILPDYEGGKLIPKPQDESQASVTKIISKDDGKINWNKTAQEIDNQFRAFYPWPGIWTMWNGKKLKILDGQPGGQTSAAPGTVLDNGRVACGGGSTLQINTLQLEGKTETDLKSFLNGYKDFAGSILQ